MMPSNQTDPVLVTIICLVYNHEPYLRQCLDGFVMQKTDFKIEAIVHDDCSTDNSRAIIQEYAEKYPSIIIPVYESENQYSKIGFSGINKLLEPYIHGKYIAFCEGDDYWTDPLKLQKQVNYLEIHPECGMVYTQAYQFEEKTGKRSLGWARQTNFEKLLIGLNTIITLTTCLRSQLFFKFQKEINPPKTWLMADYPLWLYIAYHTDIYFMNRITGEYRILENSASHSTDIRKQINFIESSLSIRLFLDKSLCGSSHKKQVFQDAVKNCFDISKSNNANLFGEIFKLSKRGKIVSVRNILKMITYSNRWGRQIIRKRLSL